MVDIRISRFNHEVLAAAPSAAASTRLTSEVVHDQQGDPTAEIQLSRFSSEVLAQSPAFAQATRLTSEVVHDQQGDPTAEIQLSRFSTEVLIEFPAEASTTRLTSEVVHDQQADASAQLQVSRMSAETLARRTLSIDACPLPAFWKYLSHNFTERFIVETSFSTSISRSAETVSEDRTQRFERPRRTVRTVILLQDEGQKNELMDVIQQLRSWKYSDWLMPLAADAAQVTAAVSSGQVVLQGDFSSRRFFSGARATVLRLRGADNQVVEVFSTTMASASETLITLDDSLPFDIEAGRACVLPGICTVPRLQDTISQVVCDAWQVQIEMQEREGSTALPPLIDGLPPNFESYRDLPILRPNHNFNEPLNIEILREGRQRELGRGIATFARGESDRVKHTFKMTERRAKAWDYLRFFESRRGRALPFWLIDQEQLFEITDLELTSIEVDKLGDFDEFKKDTQYFGFMLKDGTCYVREIITINDLPTAWQLSPVEPLPALDFNDVVLAGRARPTRMLEDSLTETWHHNDAVEFTIPVISLLNEKVVTLDA